MRLVYSSDHSNCLCVSCTVIRLYIHAPSLWIIITSTFSYNLINNLKILSNFDISLSSTRARCVWSCVLRSHWLFVSLLVSRTLVAQLGPSLASGPSFVTWRPVLFRFISSVFRFPTSGGRVYVSHSIHAYVSFSVSAFTGHSNILTSSLCMYSHAFVHTQCIMHVPPSLGCIAPQAVLWRSRMEKKDVEVMWHRVLSSMVSLYASLL